MTNRNTKTGGASSFTQEGLKPSDFNDTIAATTYERKTYNATPVTSSVSGASGTSDADTMTVSIPAGVVYKYIEIKVFMSGYASGGNFGGTNYDSSTSFRLYKTYSAVDTDLIATTTFTATSSTGSGGDADGDYDTNCCSVVYYYEPTTNEKTNGFDVKIDLAASRTAANSNCVAGVTCSYINIMGI